MGRSVVGFLFVIGAAFTLVLSNTTKKWFRGTCPLFFSFICCFSSEFVFLFASGFRFQFTRAILPYALLFGFSFAICTIFLTFALQKGSLSITGLIFSYSLILPTLYGILFFKESVNYLFFIGLLLLLISSFLIRSDQEKAENTSQKKIPKKGLTVWLIFISLAFAGNGFCSIFQTMQQKAFDGAYKCEFMVLALSVASLSLLPVSLVTERKKIQKSGKGLLLCGISSGISTGLVNLFVMYAVNYLTASLVFPLISGGSLLLTFLVALLLFKEKFHPKQYIGLFLGVASIVLLSI